MKKITTHLYSQIGLLIGLGAISTACSGKDDKAENIQDSDITEPSSEDSGDHTDDTSVTNPESTDDDGDGLSELEGDCDDNNPEVYTGAIETCDGVDSNCSGDESDAEDLNTYYIDSDNDGYGSPETIAEACEAPSGYADNPDDCDDTEATVFVGAAEICDELDNNCNSEVDEGLDSTWYYDSDNDGYGVDTDTVVDCAQPSGYAEWDGDCDDLDPAVNPGATDDVDFEDNNCNRLIDEQVCPAGLTANSAQQIYDSYVFQGSTGPYQLCLPLPTDGSSCPSFAMYPMPVDIVFQTVGPPPDSFSSWSVISGCGPDISKLTECCYVLNIGVDFLPVPGRPLRVDGLARKAEPNVQNIPHAENHRLQKAFLGSIRAHWLEVAQLEHASVASFAQLTLNLMRLGAPLELIQLSSKAQQDEVQHTEMAIDILQKIGQKTRLGPINLEGLTPLSLEELLEETIRDACINESMAAAEALMLASVEGAHFKPELDKIAEDETAHAALGWKILQWILSIRPELHTVARQSFEKYAPEPPSKTWTVSEDLKAQYGLLSHSQRLALQNQVWTDVIQPCIHQICPNA